MTELEGYEFPVKWVTEGGASLLVPDSPAPRKGSIPFYNPVAAFNRDVSLLVVASLGVERPRVADAMAGVGSRSVRYALLGAYVEANDLSPSSLSLLLRSARANGVSDSIGVQSTDARVFLSAESAPNRRFDLVDVDPFGSPAPYLDSALAAVKSGGILAFTATDLATLCGRYPRASMEKYGAFTFRSEFCHEVAVRILISYAYRRARLQGLSVCPLLSFYADHYVRVFLRVTVKGPVGPELANGFVVYSWADKRRLWGNDPRDLIQRAPAGAELGGPVWLGELSTPPFVQGLLSKLEGLKGQLERPQRVEKLLKALMDEFGYPPFYYLVPTLVRGGNPPMDAVLSKLRERGVRCSPTHFDGQGIRFDPGAEDPSRFLSGLLKP